MYVFVINLETGLALCHCAGVCTKNDYTFTLHAVPCIKANIDTLLHISNNYVAKYYIPLLGINCGPPGVSEGGVVSSNGTGVGSVATYDCKPGFVLEQEGGNKRVCNRSGNWTGSIPECKSTYSKWSNFFNLCMVILCGKDVILLQLDS